MKNILTISVFIFFLFCSGHLAEALCLKSTKANVRSGPGTQYDVVWEVYKYMPFKKVGVSVSGDWYAVRDVDGDVNWIHKSLVTNSFRCAVVRESGINIRSGPGTRYRKLYANPVEQYHSFRVMKTSGLWVRLKDEAGNIGWVRKDLLWIQ